MPGFLGRKLLPATEYLAENAFVAPGFHRLLTAAGLALGLYGGRRVMDVVTARRSSDGSELSAAAVPVLLRPLYGKMRYNPYSDDATDRWKFVADRFIPVAIGAVGAWAGSRTYAYGYSFNGKPFHAPTINNKTKYDAGNYSLQTMDSTARRLESDPTRFISAGGIGQGSTAGTHLLGGFFPLTNGGMFANTFYQINERRINLFGLKGLNRLLFGNRSTGSSSVRPAMVNAVRWAEGNIHKFGNPKDWLTEEQLLKRAKDALQNFRGVTPAMENDVSNHLRALIQEAHQVGENLRAMGRPAAEVETAIYAQLTGERPMPAGANAIKHVGLLGKPFDNLLHAAGVPLQNAELGDHNAFSFLSGLLGSTKKEHVVEQQWAEHLKTNYDITYGPSKIDLSPHKVGLAWGATGLGAAALITAGNMTAQQLKRKNNRTSTTEQDPNAPRLFASLNASVADIAAEQAAARKHESGFTHWLNGRPLDIAQWMGRVLITPPSMHRLMGAAFLSVGLIGGMKFANLLTGRDLKLLTTKSINHSLIEKEKILPFLQPLHGVLAYTPGSVALVDRWRQALHYLIPVVVGAAGTYTGSRLYFHDRAKKLDTPKTLEDYTDRISLEQSKPFAALTAITSIFNTGSGLHLLPVVNYSSNLHNRYLMASGQQVAMPGLGKWWSGNPGLTPWGIKGSLGYLSEYLTENPGIRPRELPSLLHSVIAKLYPSLSDDMIVAKKQRMLDYIYEVRDSYLVQGPLDDTKKPAFKHAMQTMMTGEGFESLLLLSGLDPLKANLASNGASGAMANALGKGGKVAALQAEYRHSFQTRVRQPSRATAHTTLLALADQSALTGPAKPESFAQRLQTETQTQLARA